MLYCTFYAFGGGTITRQPLGGLRRRNQHLAGGCVTRRRYTFFHFYGVHWPTGDTLAKWILHNKRPSKVFLGVSTKHHLMKSGKWIETIWAAFIDICNNQKREQSAADRWLFIHHIPDTQSVHIRGNRNEQGKDGHKHYGRGCRQTQCFWTA